MRQHKRKKKSKNKIKRKRRKMCLELGSHCRGHNTSALMASIHIIILTQDIQSITHRSASFI
jgi:hypothetical protein